ncbi:MAG TPA: SlyX family protein [Kofleriaceae bacterium]|nr:SlyX family protein [Kofleriaceae bacterium]
MAADVATLAEHVTDLEVRLAYQDRALAALDEVVRTLFARLEAVEQELRELRQGAAPPVGPATEPPPHY